MQANWDLIVIGAGVLGTFHAYHAARAGWRVLLLERNRWPGDASVRNFGTLMAGSLCGEWRHRGLESIATYRELAPLAGFDFTPSGSLYHGTTATEAMVMEDFARLAPPEGSRCELLEISQALKLNPFINQRSVCRTLFFPDDARVEPRSLFRHLIPWITQEFPVEYRPATVATEIKAIHGEAIVRTANGDHLHAGHAILCNGSDLLTLFPEQFKKAGFQRCKLLMLRTRGETHQLPTTVASGLTLRRYPAFGICPSLGKLFQERASPGVLEAGIHILTVQDRDGSLVIGDTHSYSSEDLDEILDSNLESLVLAEAKKILNLTHWEIIQRWHGIYSMPQDGELFRKTIDGVIHIVTGIRGKGMTTGPAVAQETIATLLNGQPN